MMAFLHLLFLVVSTINAEEITLTKADFNNITPEIRSMVPPDDPTAEESDQSNQNVEGDMKISGNLREYTVEEEAEKNPFISYNAIKGPLSRWKDGVIYYALDSVFSSRERSIIAAGIQLIQSKTCLKFVPRNGNKDYVFIFKGDGCYSWIGHVGGKQTMSLANGCLYPGIVAHEFIHASGFFHEQSRADRDDYVKFVKDNVKPGKESQFKKYSLKEIRHLGTEYDYGSIMHYSRKAFSRNNKDTLIPFDRSAEIGQRRDLSTNDALKINRFYQCENTIIPETTTKAPTTTPNPVGPVVTRRPVSPITTPKPECKDKLRNCFGLRDFCDNLEIQFSCRKTCDACDGLVVRTRAPQTTTPSGPTEPNGPRRCTDRIRNCRGLRDFCHKSNIWKQCGSTCNKC